MRHALLVMGALAAAGCRTSSTAALGAGTAAASPAVSAPPAAGAPAAGAATTPGAVASAKPASATPEQASQWVSQDCQSCHSTRLIDQQRLTSAQWTAVLNKMRGWGALLDEANVTPLALYLASAHGPGNSSYVAPRGDAQELGRRLDPLPDGPGAKGDAARGQAVFLQKCLACHGPEGKLLPGVALLGVDLVDRPILYRAAELAAHVRTGRGRMPPTEVTDAEVFDIVSFLRAVKP